MQLMKIISASFVSLALSTFSTAVFAGDEYLSFPPPPGWGGWKVLTEQRSPERIFVERIPENQSPSEVKDIVIEQYYVGIQQKISPVDLLKALPRIAQSSICEKMRATTPVGQVEHGFNVAYAQMYCPRQKGKTYGFIDLQKAIQGKNGIYVIQREWRVNFFDFQDSPASKHAFIPQEAFGTVEKAKEWFVDMEKNNEYLMKDVFLCASAPCP
jgi:hypothetical protein